MKILAIDPAKLTGWAYTATRDRIESSGVWNLGTGDNRFSHFK